MSKHDTRDSALGLHWILMLVTCLLACQVLRAHELVVAPAPEPQGSATPWGGDYFPNTALTNQDGQPVHFFDDLIKGKVVVINFIFTTCTDSCPLETARLRQVQKLLGDRVGKDVFFYSITIDPEHDTPAALKHYMDKFKVGPGWQFLTGNKQDITELRQKLGLFIEGVDNGRTKDHNLSLIVGNQSSGRWMKASPFENPWILADQLANTLQNWKTASTEQSYANAPEIRPPSNGEELFRTRCASCHSLGPMDGQGLGLRSIGPDLIGVTRNRDPQWLQRWLKEPDRMLAEKDPLAVQLYQQYDSIPMPNLRLDDVSVKSILEYLDSETNRQKPLPAPVADADTGHTRHADHAQHDMANMQ
ncbi:SCO family protein [Pseudomonas sp. TE3610]